MLATGAARSHECPPELRCRDHDRSCYTYVGIHWKVFQRPIAIVVTYDPAVIRRLERSISNCRVRRSVRTTNKG